MLDFKTHAIALAEKSEKISGNWKSCAMAHGGRRSRNSTAAAEFCVDLPRVRHRTRAGGDRDRSIRASAGRHRWFLA
ncbi:MAG: hypothetical protein JXR83_21195 [Deltaproteobacteria bacterium]|nr:hypothetical protein [Deltaproteobacteria bacterium]